MTWEIAGSSRRFESLREVHQAISAEVSGLTLMNSVYGTTVAKNGSSEVYVTYDQGVVSFTGTTRRALYGDTVIGMSRHSGGHATIMIGDDVIKTNSRCSLKLLKSLMGQHDDTRYHAHSTLTDVPFSALKHIRDHPQLSWYLDGRRFEVHGLPDDMENYVADLLAVNYGVYDQRIRFADQLPVYVPARGIAAVADALKFAKKHGIPVLLMVSGFNTLSYNSISRISPQVYFASGEDVSLYELSL